MCVCLSSQNMRRAEKIRSVVDLSGQRKDKRLKFLKLVSLAQNENIGYRKSTMMLESKVFMSCITEFGRLTSCPQYGLFYKFVNSKTVQDIPHLSHDVFQLLIHDINFHVSWHLFCYYVFISVSLLDLDRSPCGTVAI